VEKLSILKKFRGMPVPVGTIMRQGLPDTLVRVGQPQTSSTISNLTSDAPMISGVPNVPSTPGTPQSTAPQVIVVPSMVEELEPWERTERDLRAAKQEREFLAKTLLPGHESMRNLDQRINQLELALKEELTTAISSFELEKSHMVERFEELQKKMPNYRKVLNDFDEFKQDYSLMTSGKVFWENAYGDLKKRLTSMEFTGIDMRTELEFQGFTMMRDQEPVSPSKKTLLIYGVVLGLAMAGGACFGLEKFKSTTSLVSDTERITGLHAVGVLPLSKSEDQFKHLFKNTQPGNEDGYDMRESFRIIRCSLPLHVARENKCQVIMITSARPGEGKTVVSSLLARSFADSGQRTVLIDADLRRGRVSELLEGESSSGLRHWLEGKTKRLEDVTVRAPGEGLDVIVRGSYSSEAIEALGKPKFAEMVNELRQKYDRIIIDTPPVLGLADSLVTARVADGIVLVIRADKTTQRDVITGMEQILSVNVPLYGFLLNGVDLSKMENYYYYSSYYPKYYDPNYLEPSPA
ncbi:MAG: polysaccharide biosynthesis tyrosine autokinase, partial [Prosthecobacter sp.]|nr:polysaccharide biosynthesis tyrosine autokinase [Prosthecobacter sp.]